MPKYHAAAFSRHCRRDEGRAPALLAVLAEFLPRLQVGWVASAIVAGLLLSTAWRERKPLPNAKKPLVMAARAKRIYAIAFLYAAGMGLAFSFLYLSPLWWIIPIQLMPLMLAFAVWTLAPQERFVQKKYWQEAHEKLEKEGKQLQQDLLQFWGRTYSGQG